MKCPACSNILEQVTAAEVAVDVCKNGCGGIWFDNFEIKKFDEPHESAGLALLEIECEKNIIVDRIKRFNCPKCDDIVMMRHFSSVKKEVTVDECPGCGGFWLDAGELRSIRELFNSEQERDEAAHKYFNDIFGDQLKAMTSDSQAGLGKTQKIANIFRFICPSNYIPGKQDWGAF